MLNVFEENPTEPKAELYYVDYGDTDVVPCNELFELRTDFLRLHFQAIECYLAKVGKWKNILSALVIVEIKWKIFQYCYLSNHTSV